jgi:hypothetical protein
VPVKLYFLISGFVFRFRIKFFNAGFPYPIVDPDPPVLQIRVEIGFLARKFVALEAKVYFLLLITVSDPAINKEFAGLFSASLAASRRKMIKHYFEIRIFSEHRVPEQRFKSFCIRLKVTEFSLELHAVLSDLAIRVRKTFFTIQSARTQSIEYIIVSHCRSLLQQLFMLCYCKRLLPHLAVKHIITD